MSVAAAKAKEPKQQYGDFSIKRISEVIKIDRATVAKRLDALKYRPLVEEAKLKLYRFDEAMEAALLETNDKLTDVKIRKETAAAQIAELKVKQQMGELVSTEEVEDYLQRLFKALYQETVTRFPKRVASQLSKAKTPAKMSEILTAGLGQIFNTVREDHGQLLVNGKKK